MIVTAAGTGQEEKKPILDFYTEAKKELGETASEEYFQNIDDGESSNPQLKLETGGVQDEPSIQLHAEENIQEAPATDLEQAKQKLADAKEEVSRLQSQEYAAKTSPAQRMAKLDEMFGVQEDLEHTIKGLGDLCLDGLKRYNDSNENEPFFIKILIAPFEFAASLFSSSNKVNKMHASKKDVNILKAKVQLQLAGVFDKYLEQARKDLDAFKSREGFSLQALREECDVISDEIVSSNNKEEYFQNVVRGVVFASAAGLTYLGPDLPYASDDILTKRANKFADSNFEIPGAQREALLQGSIRSAVVSMFTRIDPKLDLTKKTQQIMRAKFGFASRLGQRLKQLIKQSLGKEKIDELKGQVSQFQERISKIGDSLTSQIGAVSENLVKDVAKNIQGSSVVKDTFSVIGDAAETLGKAAGEFTNALGQQAKEASTSFATEVQDKLQDPKYAEKIAQEIVKETAPILNAVDSVKKAG